MITAETVATQLRDLAATLAVVGNHVDHILELHAHIGQPELADAQRQDSLRDCVSRLDSLIAALPDEQRRDLATQCFILKQLLGLLEQPKFGLGGGGPRREA